MKIEVGKVLKAQGIKGEIKLQCFLDSALMLKELKNLYIGSNMYTIEHMRTDGTYCYAKLAGIFDRTAAEALQNCAVFADKESLILPQNRYFVQDLLDCIVAKDNGEIVGRVIDVLQYGAADVFVCQNNGKEVSFPFLNDLIIFVNVDCKKIVLSAERFAEVAVYED